MKTIAVFSCERASLRHGVDSAEERREDGEHGGCQRDLDDQSHRPFLRKFNVRRLLSKGCA